MIIIDAYCHIGDCCIFDTSVTESELIDALNANRLSAAIVQPFPGVHNPAETHDRIAELGGKHPGRIYGVANVDPHINRDRYHQEIERCVRELGFVGVALDTLGFAVNPNGHDAKTVFEVARELAIPVVIRTGWGTPFGLPSLVLPRAREYSDVKIILASAGAGSYAFEAYLVARDAPNVYLETSWARSDEIRWLTNELGAGRLLLGSDLPSNQEAELAKLRSLGLFQFQQYEMLGQNAIDLFALKGVSEYVEPAQASSLAEPLTLTEPAAGAPVGSDVAAEPAEPANRPGATETPAEPGSAEGDATRQQQGSPPTTDAVASEPAGPPQKSPETLYPR